VYLETKRSPTASLQRVARDCELTLVEQLELIEAIPVESIGIYHARLPTTLLLFGQALTMGSFTAVQIIEDDCLREVADPSRGIALRS